MRRLAILALGLIATTFACGQTAEDQSLKGQPMEITSTGGTTYEDGVATAVGNVAIHIGDVDMYADSARYDNNTKVIELVGNVRIYRAGTLYVGDRGSYNTETKELLADRLQTADRPFLVTGDRVTSIDENAKLVQKASFTTHDSANPDFQVRATTVRFYENDRVILKNATFYIGSVPVFYWPYIYQSLDDDFSFVISPAYMSSWGPSLLGRVTFPITDNVKGTLRLDYRARRGVALGFEPDIRFSKDSFARIRTYFVRDENPRINRTSLPRGAIPTDRYRYGISSRTDFGRGFSAFIKADKLSDPFFLQDFYPGEFRVNPEPDNVAAVNYNNPQYTLTAFTRVQINGFFETTERLPEIALDIPRRPLFGSGIFYESETTFANLRRDFPRGSEFIDYSALRFDSFHQFVYPRTYFDWLSVVPRAGFRSTYYSESRDLTGTLDPFSDDSLVPGFLIPPPSLRQPLVRGGDRLRNIFNTGVESSFKISRAWEAAQSRALGLDGLRHIAQPFVNFSHVVGDNSDPAEILQFDRYIPSTQLRPIDFPQFTSIDSINYWTIARLGLRNRLQTRRDDSTINWLELETYFDLNFNNPYDRSSFSNVFNNLRFQPVPWVSLAINSQLPLLAPGFSEVNTEVRFQPTAAVAFSLSHRFLNENPFFVNSSLYTLGAYARLNDHWAIGGAARYEAISGLVEEQRYTLYRDLTSWVASLGAVVRNNGGVKEYGVLLNFTLKALPKVSFDLNYDPGAPQGEAGGIAGLP
jgi:LPS-assembly protein